MADDVKDIPKPEILGRIKTHLASIPGRMNADGSSKPVFLPEGERRPSPVRSRQMAEAQPKKEEPPPQPPPPAPKEEPKPKAEEPAAGKAPEKAPAQQEPPKEEPPAPPKGRSLVDRVQTLTSQRKAVEEENALLKKEIEKLKANLPPEPVAKPDDWDGMTDDEQVNYLVEQRVNQRLGDILPRLQVMESHSRLQRELGIQLSPQQASAINSVWLGGESPLTAAEAAAIAVARDPDLFGEGSEEGAPPSAASAEVPRASPRRESKDPEKELFERFAQSPITQRRRAGMDLLRHRMGKAFSRMQ